VNTRRFLTIAGTALGLAALLATATPASADPSGAPQYRALAGAGSDTTQDVMNGLADAVTDGTGAKVIGSYDAFGSATIVTKDPAASPNCDIPRPAGSGAGVNALVNALQNNTGCLQFARSSSNSSAGFPGKNLTYIPFATDAVTYAVRSDSTISKKLTLAQLTKVFNCEGGANYKPMLPQFSSGTRSFFLSKLGFTDAANFTQLPGHTCIGEKDSTDQPLQENNGLLLTDPKQIAPYSIAQYIAQTTGIVQDVHGKTVLAQLDGISATILNTSSTMSRSVFNVVPTGQLANEPYKSVFAGPDSAICTKQDVIKKYGFGPNAKCGDLTIQTP
jgi:ABC-type phosphate transport system substrate-binding protein